MTPFFTPSRARLWLGAYLVVALALTLVPTSSVTRPPFLVPLTGIRGTFEVGGPAFGVVQLVGNLLLLAPVGVLLPRAITRNGGVGARHVLVAALLLSVGIELLQWRMGAGRQADVDDVWTNTLGAVAAYLLTRPSR